MKPSSCRLRGPETESGEIADLWNWVRSRTKAYFFSIGGYRTANDSRYYHAEMEFR